MNYSLDALAEHALHTLGELEASWLSNMSTTS
jgi:hypothetical protein